MAGHDYYVYSTLTADTAFTGWKKIGEDKVPEKDGVVLVKGGTGVANRHFLTPHGVVTGVSTEEAEFLMAHPLFQQQEKDGFVKIEKAKVDPEVVAADMKLRDGSSPLVPEDFGEDDPKPVVNRDNEEIPAE